MLENPFRYRFQRRISCTCSIQIRISLNCLMSVYGTITIRNGSPHKFPQLLGLLTGHAMSASNGFSVSTEWGLGSSFGHTFGHASATLLLYVLSKEDGQRRRHQGGWMLGRP